MKRSGFFISNIIIFLILTPNALGYAEGSLSVRTAVGYPSSECILAIDGILDFGFIELGKKISNCTADADIKVRCSKDIEHSIKLNFNNGDEGDGFRMIKRHQGKTKIFFRTYTDDTYQNDKIWGGDNLVGWTKFPTYIGNDQEQIHKIYSKMHYYMIGKAKEDDIFKDGAGGIYSAIIQVVLEVINANQSEA